MATVIAGPARVQRVRALDIAIGVELFLLIVIAGRTYTFFPFVSVSVINWLTFLIPLAALPLIVVRYPYSAIVTIAVMVIVLGYQYWFAGLWHTQFSGALLGSYQSLLLAPLVALLSARFSASRFVRIFYIAAIVHLFLYLLLYLMLDPDMIRYQAMSGEETLNGQLRRTHEASASTSIEYSDFKIATSDAAMAFVVLYSISQLYGMGSLLSRFGMAVLTALSVYGLWVSDSRWNMASTLIALIALMLPMGSRARAWLGFATAAGAILLWILAAALPLNPFSLTEGDRSGYARALQFEAANPVFWQTPVLGIGLPNQSGDLEAVFSETVYIADLGYYGDMLSTGFVGILLILIAFWYIAWFTANLSASASESNERAARFLSAFLVYIAVDQIFSPQLTSGVGGVFLSLALGYLGRRDAVVLTPPRRLD